MKKYFIYLLLLIFSVNLTFSQSSAKKNIAVIDMASRGVLAKNETQTLTDRLRSELVRTKVFNVLTRDKMEEILDEQAFQQTGCTSKECAVEIGKVLQVELILTGTIGKFGKKYSIEIYLIEVETSQILDSYTLDHRGDVEDMLDLMKSITNQIVGKTGSISSYSKESGTLIVNSGSIKAEVFLDNIKIGETPLKKDYVAIGQYTIKIIADGYAPGTGTINIEKGVSNKYFAQLKKTHNIVIISTPSEAEVFINGKYVGMTPYNMTSIEGSQLNIKVSKKNRKEWINEIVVMGDDEIMAKLKGKSKAWLWLGTLALAGGGTYYYKYMMDKEKSNEDTGFVSPPGRP